MVGRGIDTKDEMSVASLVGRLGFRFRLCEVLGFWGMYEAAEFISAKNGVRCQFYRGSWSSKNFNSIGFRTCINVIRGI